MHHRIWISAKRINAGQPGIIHAWFDKPGGQREGLEWETELAVPEGARVVQDPEGSRGRVAWIEWDDLET